MLAFDSFFSFSFQLVCPYFSFKVCAFFKKHARQKYYKKKQKKKTIMFDINLQASKANNNQWGNSHQFLKIYLGNTGKLFHLESQGPFCFCFVLML